MCIKMNVIFLETIFLLPDFRVDKSSKIVCFISRPFHSSLHIRLDILFKDAICWIELRFCGFLETNERQDTLIANEIVMQLLPERTVCL